MGELQCEVVAKHSTLEFEAVEDANAYLMEGLCCAESGTFVETIAILSRSPMTQLQDLSRVLSSAGGAVDPEEKGTYFLSTSNGMLTSRFLVGGSVRDQELLAKDVRKDSSAVYLLSTVLSLIIYITSSSALCVIEYDQEEEDWFGCDDIPSQRLHAEGKAAACFVPGSERNFYVFLQDPSRRIICYDNEWTRRVLPADARAGTPLFATVINDRVHVFYVGSKDYYLHYLVEDIDGVWVDNVMVRSAFHETLTRLTVARNGDGFLEAYILTIENVVLQTIGDARGETRELGQVDKSGYFRARMDAKRCPFVWAPTVRWHEMPRVSHRCLCW
ncbi:hypothetical protein NM688_g257 [Phlebia brevispora]|uniref:Uncharacterized protein n=1 Tax=Phlebia brevispora TaxID=194682 RepID=A0ACC1TET4_9APHY|nr:hypothetical protein NM688_g257 [Phlebia brevispora]